MLLNDEKAKVSKWMLHKSISDKYMRVLTFIYYNQPVYLDDIYGLFGGHNASRDFLNFEKRLTNILNTGNNLYLDSGTKITHKEIYENETLYKPFEINKFEFKDGYGYSREMISLTAIASRYFLKKTEKTLRPTPAVRGLSQTSSYRVLYTHLQNQHSASMFYRVGVPTLPCEKPSLYYLTSVIRPDLIKGLDTNRYMSLSQYYMEASSHIFKMNDELMDEFISRFKKETHLDTGIFYSKYEVLDFLKIYGINYTDGFKGIPWHGLFISDKQIIVVFSLNPTNSDRIMVLTEPLSRMIAKLEDVIAPLTNCLRDITEIEYRDNININKTVSYYKNRIEALILGKGESFIYSAASGNKSGVIKNMDLSYTRNHASENAVFKHDILDCTSRVFDRIYLVSDDEDSSRQLKYLTTHSIEAYLQDQEELFGAYPECFKSNSNTKQLLSHRYEIKDKREDGFVADAVYIPVFEAKLLNSLYERGLTIRKRIKVEGTRTVKEEITYGKPLVVACTRPMMEPIAHSIRLEHVLDGSKRLVPGLRFHEVEYVVDEDDVNVEYTAVDGVADNLWRTGAAYYYNHKGIPAGKLAISEVLKETGTIITNKTEYEDLRRKIYDSLDDKEKSQLIDSRIVTEELDGEVVDTKIKLSAAEKTRQFWNYIYYRSLKEQDFISDTLKSLNYEIPDKAKKLEKRFSRRDRYKNRLTVFVSKEDKAVFDLFTSTYNESITELARSLIVDKLNEIKLEADSENISLEQALADKYFPGVSKRRNRR